MNSHFYITSESHDHNEGDELEIGRLISAAVVDREFCDLLLRDPSTALEKGFYGERFRLSSHQRQFILSVKATSLINFAAQWVSREG